jgi:hypothetical protein
VGDVRPPPKEIYGKSGRIYQQGTVGDSPYCRTNVRADVRLPARTGVPVCPGWLSPDPRLLSPDSPCQAGVGSAVHVLCLSVLASAADHTFGVTRVAVVLNDATTRPLRAKAVGPVERNRVSTSGHLDGGLHSRCDRVPSPGRCLHSPTVPEVGYGPPITGSSGRRNALECVSGDRLRHPRGRASCDHCHERVRLSAVAWTCHLGAVGSPQPHHRDVAVRSATATNEYLSTNPPLRPSDRTVCLPQ